MIMRVLSNYASVGKDVSSYGLKIYNKRVSEEAKELLFSADLATYSKNTINEHSKPLKITWNWLKKKANELSVEKVWEEFKKNPIITVTREENQRITKKGLGSKGSFEERYTNLGIFVTELQQTPKEIKKNDK